MLVAVTLVAGSAPHIELERFPTLEACRQITSVVSEMVLQMPEAQSIPHNTQATKNDANLRRFGNGATIEGTAGTSRHGVYYGG